MQSEEQFSLIIVVLVFAASHHLLRLVVKELVEYVSLVEAALLMEAWSFLTSGVEPALSVVNSNETKEKTTQIFIIKLYFIPGAYCFDDFISSLLPNSCGQFSISYFDYFFYNSFYFLVFCSYLFV